MPNHGSILSFPKDSPKRRPIADGRSSQYVAQVLRAVLRHPTDNDSRHDGEAVEVVQGWAESRARGEAKVDGMPSQSLQDFEFIFTCAYFPLTVIGHWIA